MLQINGKIIVVSDYKIKEKLSGISSLEFDIHPASDVYPDLLEEAVIIDTDSLQEYVIKKVDANEDRAKVYAEINLDAWKQSIVSYVGKAKCSTIIDSVKPSGWSVTDATKSSDTIELKSENKVPLDVLHDAIKASGYVPEFDTVRKTVTLRNPAAYVQQGAYAMKGLNMLALEYKGQTSKIITRLYAKGKDGITFASINGGKEYVDCFDYTDKVIAGYLNTSIEDPAQLLEEARKAVKEAAKPVVAYTCNVVDLAATSSEYSWLDIGLLSRIKLLDSIRRNAVVAQVTEYERHPLNPDKNVVTLNGTLQTVTSTVHAQLAEASKTINDEFDVIVRNSVGLYSTLVETSAGAFIYYFHDKPELKDSRTVWKLGSNAFAVSTDGGETWNAGMTDEGNMIANILTATGINATWINTGAMTVKDATGNVVFKADMANKTVNIAGFTIKGDEIISNDGHIYLSSNLAKLAFHVAGLSIGHNGGISTTAPATFGGDVATTASLIASNLYATSHIWMTPLGGTTYKDVMFVYPTEGTGANLLVGSQVDGVYIPNLITSSDRSKKKSIEKLGEQHLELLKHFVPVSYIYRDDPKGKVHFGFIAQDVYDALFEAGINPYETALYVETFDEKGNTTCALRYEEITALNTKAIQELTSKVESQNERIEKLEELVSHLLSERENT